MSPIGVRWLIAGRVQGVGFRWFVCREAEQLGIRGWARNLPDGRVEVVGAGTPGAMAEFERALARGPALARVDSLHREEFPHQVDEFNSFYIK